MKRGAVTRGALLGIALAILAAIAAAPAAARDVQRVEAVGAVGLDPDAAWTTPPRDAALRQALSEAVAEVARAETPELALDPGDADALLQSALGDDPFAYATRFRILQDRGERAALLVQEPGIEREYVVVVEAYVDAQRVRERLARAGLRAAPSGDGERARFDLVVLGLDSYAAYTAVREALVDGAGAESATPVEISRGRAVFSVEAGLEPSQVLRRLVATSGPELEIVPLEDEGRARVVRVELRDLPADAAGDGARAFDTPGRNRY